MLFSETVTEMGLNQKNDLRRILDHLKNFTSQKGDSSKIYEFFCLYTFLIGSFQLGRLSFPVKIISRESPDFEIISEGQNSEVGLEHTKATLESFKIAESELKKHPEGSVIELCSYSPFVEIPNKQSDVGIVSPKGRLQGKGWSGNQVEHEWSEVMLTALRRKTKLLNEKHFEIKERNDLFIEDDSPVNFVKDEDEAIQVLRQEFTREEFSSARIFDNVHIFSNCTLIYDVFGECLKIGLRKKEFPEF